MTKLYGFGKTYCGNIKGHRYVTLFPSLKSEIANNFKFKIRNRPSETHGTGTIYSLAV